MKPLLIDTNVLIKFFQGDEEIAKNISRYEKVIVPTIVSGGLFI